MMAAHSQVSKSRLGAPDDDSMIASQGAAELGGLAELEFVLFQVPKCEGPGVPDSCAVFKEAVRGSWFPTLNAKARLGWGTHFGR